MWFVLGLLFGLSAHPAPAPVVIPMTHEQQVAYDASRKNWLVAYRREMHDRYCQNMPAISLGRAGINVSYDAQMRHWREQCIWPKTAQI